MTNFAAKGKFFLVVIFLNVLTSLSACGNRSSSFPSFTIPTTPPPVTTSPPPITPTETEYTATPSAGAQGTIAPSTVQTVDSGSSISFSATPDSDYVVDQWFVDGVVVQTSGASFQLSDVVANHTVSVTFQRPIARYAYVTQYGSIPAVVVCTVDPVTGLLSNCGDVGAHSVLDTINPQDISINNQGTIAYITAYNDLPYAYQCTINRNDGTFSACSATSITTPSGYDTQYGMIALNSANTTAFIPDAGGSGRIVGCPIIGSLISSTCLDTGATGVPFGGVGIVLNTSNTIAYIGGYSSPNITQCSVNGSTFSSCINITGDGSITFTSPSGVVLNSSGNILYVADASTGNVYGCNTTQNGSSFSSCFIATTGISDAWGIKLNAQGTVAYVTDYISTVHICPILQNGTFPTCTANASFTSPVNIALLY